MVEKNFESRLDDLESLLTQLDMLSDFDQRQSLFQCAQQELEKLATQFEILTREDSTDEC